MAYKLKVATASLCGCFGCHMSFLDIDERLLELVQVAEFDRSPITDIKTVGDALDRLADGDEALTNLRGFGLKSLAELKKRLRARGFVLPGDEPGPDEESGEETEE